MCCRCCSFAAAYFAADYFAAARYAVSFTGRCHFSVYATPDAAFFRRGLRYFFAVCLRQSVSSSLPRRWRHVCLPPRYAMLLRAHCQRFTASVTTSLADRHITPCYAACRLNFVAALHAIIRLIAASRAIFAALRLVSPDARLRLLRLIFSAARCYATIMPPPTLPCYDALRALAAMPRHYAVASLFSRCRLPLLAPCHDIIFSVSLMPPPCCHTPCCY